MMKFLDKHLGMGPAEVALLLGPTVVVAVLFLVDTLL